MPDELSRQLSHLKAQLQDAVFVEGSLVYDHDLSITPANGMDGFCAVAEAVKPKVIFYYFLRLVESDFTITPLQPDDDDGVPLRPAVNVQGNARIKPFLNRLGQPQTLTAYFLYEGHQIVSTLEADWNSAFQKACEAAYEEELQRQEVQKEKARQASKNALDEGLENSRKRLIAELPTDAEFCRLACASRPRVTDLYSRAAEVLGEEDWEPYQGLLSYTIRLIAEEIKVADREARKRR